MRSAREATLSAISAQQNAMANSSPLRRATRRPQPTCSLSRSATARSTRSPLAWPSMSLICWNLSRPSTRSATLPCSVSAREIIAARSGVQRVAVGEAGQRIVLGQIPDLFGLALAHRDVAHHRAILEPSAPCQPEKQASTGNISPLLAAALDSMTLPPGPRARRQLPMENGSRRAAIAAHRSRRTAGRSFPSAVAEDRDRARVPHRDQAVLIGADQAIAERHRDPLEAALRDAARAGSRKSISSSAMAAR